jgi:hypothetical protein
MLQEEAASLAVADVEEAGTVALVVAVTSGT